MSIHTTWKQEELLSGSPDRGRGIRSVCRVDPPGDDCRERVESPVFSPVGLYETGKTICQRQCTVKFDDDDDRANIAHFFESDAAPEESRFPPAVRKTLTDILVFFAYTDNHPDTIAAAAIIDDPIDSVQTGGDLGDLDHALTLAVAINSGEFKDTESTLVKVCEAYREVFRTLAEIPHREMDLVPVKMKLMMTVVALAREKITWQFGSVDTCARGKLSGPKRPLAPLFKRLKTFLEQWDARLHDTRNAPPGMAQHTRNLRQLVNEFHPLFGQSPRNSPVPYSDDLLIRALVAIGEFVSQMHTMDGSGDNAVEAFFDALLCATDKTEKDNFIRRFIALSWYARGTAFLCNLAAGKVRMNNAPGNAAVKWPSRIRVDPVQMPPEAYENDEGHASAPSLPLATATLSASCSGRQRQLDSANTQAAETRPSRIIHAEFQIMVYIAERYTESDLASRSFYISSFKKPCVSCYAFMTRFPNVHCPSSHGKLYPRWGMVNVEFLAKQAPLVLPRCAQLQVLFQQTLDAHLLDPPCSSPSIQQGHCEELELRMHPAIDKRAYFLTSQKPQQCPRGMTKQRGGARKRNAKI